MSRDEFEELTSENHAVTKKKMTVDKFFQQGGFKRQVQQYKNQP